MPEEKGKRKKKREKRKEAQILDAFNKPVSGAPWPTRARIQVRVSDVYSISSCYVCTHVCLH